MEEPQKTIGGFILLDKPAGPSSHAMVNFLRHLTGVRKIGHAGTLDPFASGLLLCAIGREYTKRLGEFLESDKEYEAVLRLGVSTDTYDREGKIINEYEGEKIAAKEAKAAVVSFLGKQKQVPPMFSAKKIGGKKLYELARAGKEIERAPSEIEIFKIAVLKYKWPELKIRVKCSSGTYVRSLAYDIGEKLGCHAHLKELRRTAIGALKIGQAIKKDKLNALNWRKALKIL